MKIAAFLHHGVPTVGLVSSDSLSVQPYALSKEAATLGALPIIEALARGAALPALQAAVPLASVQLTAPIPRPRRNIFLRG
jgi:hypothetical protein